MKAKLGENIIQPAKIPNKAFGMRYKIILEKGVEDIFGLNDIRNSNSQNINTSSNIHIKSEKNMNLNSYTNMNSKNNVVKEVS